MSLRLRLALWYGGLTGLIILLVCVLVYSLHTRAHYDDVDYVLQSAGDHILQEYLAGALNQGANRDLSAGVAPGLVIRFYGPAGQVVAESSSAQSAPVIDPLVMSKQPSEPAYDPVAGLAPAFVAMGPAGGVFRVATGTDNTRWRVYLLAIGGAREARYVANLTPIDRLDASIEGFRRMIVLLAIAGAILSFAAGWLLARRGLRPVSALTETANAVALSGDLGRRVPEGTQSDELGQMASTFNKMLANVEQAYQAQQRFVADASHELRAPLTAIQGNLELLERKPDMDPADRQEAITEAGREAGHLTRLVVDLLALARADAGVPIRKERVEIDRVLLDALAGARHMVRGQRIDVDDLEPLAVTGDPDHLQQLALILIDNAIKYTPAGGQVTLKLRRRGGVAEIVVQDTGAGIPPEDLPHVFERFYRADPGRARDPGGTGLGLSIALWITRQHRGEIVIESVPGQGTVATVRLPVLP